MKIINVTVFAKVFFFISILLIGNSCNKDRNDPTVTYDISCSPSGFTLSYSDINGTIIYDTVATDSWTYSFEGTKGDPVVVTAASLNKLATIKVKIHHKGTIIQHQESTGDYAYAMAWATLK